MLVKSLTRRPPCERAVASALVDHGPYDRACQPEWDVGFAHDTLTIRLTRPYHYVCDGG